MGVTMTSYAQYGNASLTVTNSAELDAAINQLSSGSGGTINVDPNGGPYDMHVSGVGSSNAPILIQSAGGGDPVFHSVTIQHSEYITIDGIDMDTSHMTGRQYWEDDLRIENSNNIEIHNSTFTGHAQGYLSEGSATEAPTGVKGHSAAYMFDSQDITFSGNTFSNHFNTFRAEDIQNLVFDDNEITAFQGDGFHAGGLQNAQITNNHMHTPLGSTQTITHSDFIHIRVLNADTVNDGIEISGNLIDSGSGWGAQGIHIRNTQFGSGNQWDGYLQNISIHDNVIHTSLPRGIGVDDVQGLEVYNNTVLWNSASQIETTPDSTPISWDARILIYNSPGANISDNVASYIRTDGVLNPNGGYMINYNDPSAANYVGNHFVNVDGSGDPNSYDLNLLQSSSLYGNVGAAMSSGGTATSTGVLGASAFSAPAPVVAPTTTNSADDTSSAPDSSSNDTSGGDTGGATVAPLTSSSDGSDTGDTSSGSGAPDTSGGDDGSSGDTVAPTQINVVDDAPTVINDDIVAPAPAPSTTSTGGDQSAPDDTGGSTDTGSADDSQGTADTGGAVAGASGGSAADDAADDTTPDVSAPAADDGASVPKGQAKKMARQQDDADDDDSNIIAKFFSMLFGGDDDDDSSADAGPAPKGMAKGQGLDDIVPVTEWLDDSDTSSTASDDEDEDDDMMAA